jgi:hypothetical protein
MTVSALGNTQLDSAENSMIDLLAGGAVSLIVAWCAVAGWLDSRDRINGMAMSLED